MNIQSFSLKLIYKVSSLLLMIGLMLSSVSINQVSTVSAQVQKSSAPSSQAFPDFRLPWDRNAENGDILWTGGPHSWSRGGRLTDKISASRGSGLDFAKVKDAHGHEQTFIVLSMASGKVIMNDCGYIGFGCIVAIKHDIGGSVMIYAHLYPKDQDKHGHTPINLLQVNTWYPQGTPIGFSGQSGGQPHIHLHIELRDGIIGPCYAPANTDNGATNGDDCGDIGWAGNPVGWGGNVSIHNYYISGYFDESLNCNPFPNAPCNTIHNYDGSAVKLGVDEGEILYYHFPYLDNGIGRKVLAFVDQNFTCNSTTNCEINTDKTVFADQGKFSGGGGLLNSTNELVPPITVTPPTPPTQPPGQWYAQYYSAQNWGSPACSRDFDGSGLVGADFYDNWDASAPCTGMPTDHFSARYTGNFSFSSAGTYWFKVHHDDGAILLVDGNVLQNWPTSGDDCPAITLTSGTHALRIDYQENTGGASVGLEVRNSDCPHPTPPDPRQWHAQYYSDHNWSSLQCERYFYGSGITGTDFSENWDGSAPCPNMPTDNFSARYSVRVSIASTAVYYFHVNHDDTARLNIDGEDLQNWDHSGDDCPARTLTAGMHDFLIDYRENTGSAHISFEVLTSLCFPPGSSSKISPTSGAIDQPMNNLTLTWEFNPGATSYEYCYDTTDDNACSSWIAAGAATSASLSSLSPNTTYYWQVRSSNSRGSTETNQNSWWSFHTTDTLPARVSTSVNVPSVNHGDQVIVTVSLNNVPAEGYSSAEFTCTYDPNLLEPGNIAVSSLFGANAVSAINGLQAGRFIVAIAGSRGNKATTSGSVFTFDGTALKAGQTSVECTARVSKGDGKLSDLESNGPVTLTIDGGTITPTATPTETATSTPTPTDTPASPVTSTPTATQTPTTSPTPTPSETATPTSTATPTTLPPGTLNGRVLAGKPVSVTLNGVPIPVNSDGTFSAPVDTGTYPVEAKAEGFLRAVGSVTIQSGGTTTLPTVTLLAGDITGDDKIDPFDAMSIGMNYGAATPTEADLNNDGTINVLDLELLAANYPMDHPIVWQ